MWAYTFWTACMVRGEVFLSRWWGFSLTESTDLTEPFWCMRLFIGSFFSHRAHRVHGAFWRTFRAHRRPPAYRIHRTFQLMLAVMFCEFCRPQGLCEMLCVLFICVFLWEKECLRAVGGGFSLTERTYAKVVGCIFSHRTHRFNRTLLRTVSIPQNASGIQNSQNVIAKGGCNALWNRLT